MEQKERPQLEDNCHSKSHRKLDGEPEIHRSKGVFNKQYTFKLAKPRRAQLCNALESYRHLMSHEKQLRIECELKKDKVEPEKSEDDVVKISTEEKKKIEREKAKKLLCEIERKVANDIYDEVTDRLMKKLPKLMGNYRQSVSKTPLLLSIECSVYKAILKIIGEPKDEHDQQYVQKMSTVIAEFIVKTKLDLLNGFYKPDCRCFKVEQLKSLDKNKELMKIAQKLKAKLKNK